MNDEGWSLPDDSPDTVPASPPTLVHGRAARYWVRLQILGHMVTLAGIVAMPVISLLPDASARYTLVPVALFVAFGPGLVGTWIAFLKKVAAARREYAAGYTTLDGQGFVLWQLDPKTGVVLRRPGERQVRRRERGGT